MDGLRERDSQEIAVLNRGGSHLRNRRRLICRVGGSIASLNALSTSEYSLRRRCDYFHSSILLLWTSHSAASCVDYRHRTKSKRHALGRLSGPFARYRLVF